MVNDNWRIKISIFIIFFIIFFPIKCLASNVQFDFTKEYENWINLPDYQKNHTVFPEASTSIFSKVENVEAWSKDIYIIEKNIRNMSINFLNSSFNLADNIDFNILNQGNTEECWAFATLESMESNLNYKQNNKEKFSVRHMDYATSSSFFDSDVENLRYKRDVKSGGIPEIGLAYLCNGQGAVKEKEMPFKNDSEKISINEVDIRPSYYVSDYVRFPSIYKEYNNNSISYFDSYGNKYDYSDVITIRNQIKEYLLNYGSIIAVTASSYKEGYNYPAQYLNSNNYCCLDSSKKRNHVITIVGWDDNYNRNNFSSRNKPKQNGAYIVMQNYGEDAFNKGYIYISYEDCNIETILYGINGSKKIDYDKIYQNDFFGANGTLNIKNCKNAYFSTSFLRDKSKKETLTQVSVNLPQDSKIEIWINPNGNDVSKKKMIKVSNSEILKAGYHVINIEPTELKGDSFSIVVKQSVDSSNLFFNVEFKQDDYFYSNVSNDSGNRISLDGENWFDLKNNAKNEKTRQMLNDADLCIKAFSCYDNYDN